MTTKDFNLVDFTQVEVKGAFKVEIIQSESFSISVTADNFPHIRVEVVNDTLKIGRQGIEWLAPFHSQPSAIIKMPVLNGVSLSGASKGSVENFISTKDFAVILSGASHMDARNISAGNIKVVVSGASRLAGEIKSIGNAQIEVTGASKLELSGITNDMDLDVTGASNAELGNFQIKNANVKVSGASKGTIDLNGKLDANVSGASNLYWSGSPIMGDIQVSGASKLHRK